MRYEPSSEFFDGPCYASKKILNCYMGLKVKSKLFDCNFDQRILNFKTMGH